MAPESSPAYTAGPQPAETDTVPVTVVICARDRGMVMARCLEAVRQARPAEVIVVDGNSSDETVPIARSYGALVIGDGGRGLGAARQAGAEAATSEYIVYVDSDTVIEPSTLRKLIDEAITGGYDGLQARLRTLGDRPTYWQSGELWRRAVQERPGPAKALGCQATIYRRDVVVSVGFDPLFSGAAEDGDFSFRARAAGARLGFASHAVAYHDDRVGLVDFIRQRLWHGRGLARMAVRHNRRYGHGAARQATGVRSGLRSSGRYTAFMAVSLAGLAVGMAVETLHLAFNPTLRRALKGAHGRGAPRSGGRNRSRVRRRSSAARDSTSEREHPPPVPKGPLEFSEAIVARSPRITAASRKDGPSEMATIASLSRPRWRSWPTMLAAYLALLVAGELAVTFVNPLLVFPVHGGLVALAALVFVLPYDDGGPSTRRRATVVALVLAVAPLIRIISLTLPLAALEPALRYLAAGVPMALGAIFAARAAGLGRREIGLVWRKTGWQVAVILMSVGLGFVEFAILRPESQGPFPWTALGALPALSLGFFTGFPEELIFRGLMQTATRPLLGRWNWVYVSGIFAALHIGYQSYIDVLFVLVVGLLYGWVFERTRSIVGIAIGHGVANVVLFFVAPNLIPVATPPIFGPGVEYLVATTATAVLAVAGYAYWRVGSSPSLDAGRPPVVAQDPVAGRRHTSAPVPEPVGLNAGAVAPKGTARAAGAAAAGLRLTVEADPHTTLIDRSRHVIPAMRILVPVMVQIIISASQVEVVGSPARGRVRFVSRDTREVSIETGMVVQTVTGLAFRTTDAAVMAPDQEGTGRSADVPIEAAVSGPEGNVGARQITVIPPRLEGLTVTVVNLEPLAGGVRHEVRSVGTADYEAGVRAATAALWSELAVLLAAERPHTGAGRYAQPDTAELLDVRIDPPARQVVNTQVDSLVLTARATASVTAVDVASLQDALSAFVTGSVPYGLELVPGSLQGRVIAAEPRGERVKYLVEATSWRVRRMVVPPQVA